MQQFKNIKIVLLNKFKIFFSKTVVAYKTEMIADYEHREVSEH